MTSHSIMLIIGFLLRFARNWMLIFTELDFFFFTAFECNQTFWCTHIYIPKGRHDHYTLRFMVNACLGQQLAVIYLSINEGSSAPTTSPLLTTDKECDALINMPTLD